MNKEIYIKYFKKNRKGLLLLILIIGMGTIVSGINPYVYGKIVDSISDKNVYSLKKWLLLFGTILIVTLILESIESLVGNWLTNITENQMKLNLFGHIFSIKCKKIDIYETGELFNKIEFDIENIVSYYLDCKIGTLKEGFWRGKVENLLNIEKITHDECCNCWVYSECTNCARHCDDCIAHDRKNILDTCKQVRNSVEETFKDYTVLKELGYDFCIKSEEDILNSTEKEEINAPILAIGNFWIDAQNESLKVAELIYDQMAKIGYRVAILLEEELIENVPSFSNNILNINKRIKKCEIEENPDLIIVVVPGNIVEVSDKLCGDSGTYLYMLSQSISIDSMIVNIPYFTELLQESQNVNNEIERIVGIKAYINVLPKYLDIAVSEEEGRADYLTLSTNFIIDKINKIDDERLYCSDDYESLSSLTMQIIDELSSYAGNNEVQEINNIVIEDVEEKVMEIIKQIGEKDCAIDCLKNESLFGEKIKMRARDMLVVFFELEKQFDICFTEDDIKDYTFVSIEKISACIKKHLNK